MSPGLLRALVLAGAALAGVPLGLLAPALLRRLGLERANFQGVPICTGGGLLFLLSALAWLPLATGSGERAAALAAAGFALLGLIDDRWGTAEFKGLRGHLRALKQGRLTTGLLKAAGGGAIALAVTSQLRPLPEALVSAALVALAANLFNLLDLRPLRALKAFWLLGGALAWSGPLLLAAVLGLSVPYARLEARREVMLGDTGANGLGALLGVSAVLALPFWAQGAALALLLLFHVWAEKHSLSRWIEARPWARAIDGWGWRDVKRDA